MLRPNCLTAVLLVFLVSALAVARPVRHAQAARPAAAAATTYTFVAYGDTRSFPDVHRTVVAEILRQHPDFVLETGDCVLDGGDKSEWDVFDSVIAPIRAAHIPYYPARGNHDLGQYYRREVQDPTMSGNGFYYVFERHKNLFIAVDCFEDDDPGSDQYQWLEKCLQYGQTHDVNTFVFFHESPFSVGPHGPNPESRQYLHPLFVKYHPRCVFCGHDHLYYRTVRDGVTYLVTGGGGAELYQPTHASLAIPGDFYQSVHHIIRLDVAGAHVTGTVLTPDDKVIDRFSL
jgi:hypothetical protein